MIRFPSDSDNNGSVGKEPVCMQEMQEMEVGFLGREDPLA